MAHKQFCTFYLDNYFFGVDVQRVQEIIRYQEMTPVPLAKATVRGLINLRGQIVTAMDMRIRLALSKRDGDELPMNVVIHSEDSVVSMLVDAIGDVLDVDDDCFESTPETVDSRAREIISGVYKLEDKLMLVLDTDLAIALSETDEVEEELAV